MITVKDAIAVGAAICHAAQEVSKDAATPDVQKHLVRGTCLTALDIIWYDVLPDKTRAMFSYSKDVYYRECGWPE